MNKVCFIICPIGETDSLIRKRSDQLFRHVLSPLLATHGYDAIRADHIPKVGIITAQVISMIIESPLVLADLTGGNPNVFYELAIRHATGKPYIQIIEKGEAIPFDLNTVRTVEIDTSDLDSVASATQQIANQIEQFEKGHTPDSPISMAASIRVLQSDQSYAEKMLEKVDQIAGLGYSSIDDLDDKLDEILSKLEEMESSSSEE